MYNALINTEYEWIPEAWRPFYIKMLEHDAWYSGDPLRLSEYYSAYASTPSIAGYQWSREIYKERSDSLHLPIAGDLAGTSASLLFGEAPKFIIDDDATQERMQDIIDSNGLEMKLLEAAEICAALSGVFVKLNWDVNFAKLPILSFQQPDRAFPEFKWGFLHRVTFWEVIAEDEDKVWRLLEIYEIGKIKYELYFGDRAKLGIQVSLEAMQETMDLPEEIVTGIDDILCRYVPNVKPNKQFRHSNLGQSDFQGIEGLMDALDAAYTAWMKDIDLAKAKILIPEDWLQLTDDGTPVFNKDQDVFVKMGVEPSMDGAVKAEAIQFQIRTDEFYKTCAELFLKIVTLAGYSPQTFGINLDNGAESGKALNIREKKTGYTKGKKSKYWKVALEEMMKLALQLDNSVFSQSNIDERPTIEFTDSTGFDINILADTIEKIERARSTSVKTRVRMLHPDWDEADVEEEVKIIMEEYEMILGEGIPEATPFEMEE